MVAAVFGLISSLYTAFTGDESAYQVAQKQPMKLAASEGLYNGEKSAGLVAAGVLDPSKSLEDQNDPFLFKVKIPGLLSLLSNRTPGTFVPGIHDLVYGNEAEGIESVESKMAQGKTALESLKVYKESKISGNLTLAESSLASFNENQKYMGYGHLSSPKDVVPPVGILFYSFHLMVALGSFFILFFAVAILLAYKDKLSSIRPFLWTGVASFFLGIISSEAGWVVAEVGRQPWAIQDMLPVTVAATNIGRGNVQATFFMFLIVFTILLVAEIMIMLKQISIGPQER
jgi:cytochrome d ubiquinol oxidase subunit I